MGPIFTLALVAPTRGATIARRLILASIREGQLYWCATALAASGTYEAVEALARGTPHRSLLQCCLAVFCLSAFASSILVMLQTMELLDDRYRQGGRRRGRMSGPLPVCTAYGAAPSCSTKVSIGMVVIVVTAVLLTHTQLV